MSRKYLPIDTQEIVEHYKKGESASQIARRYDCCVSTITRRLKEASIEIRNPGYYQSGKCASIETKQKMAVSAANARQRNGTVLRRVVPCTNCGKPTMKHNRDLVESVNQFCTHECYSRWKTTVVGKEHPLYKRRVSTCPQCNGIIEFAPSRFASGGQVFCEKECHNEWMHENQKAENHPSWQGGKTKYPGRGNGRDYKRLKENIFQRDGFRCTECGTDVGLELHHVKSWSTHPELRYEPTNCLTVCKKCHRLLDSK